MLLFADYFFLVFHALLVLFILTGWIFRRTRGLHLLIILLTFASWFVLGIWFGLGYCPLTDWHWEVLRKLGNYNLPHSYVSYLIDRITGVRLDDVLVDFITMGSAFIVLVLSIRANFFRKK